MTFQRARSEEQREVRRRVILDTAAAMLVEMPAGDVTLNELSRRVGLAKSNVLRYFESREAVLLELLDNAVAQWVSEVVAELADAAEGSRPVAERGDRLAAVLSASLSRHRMLCDLIAAQPGVLEHNASVEVVLRLKRNFRDNVFAVAQAARGLVPELGPAAESLCVMAAVLAGALWSHSQCSDSVREAYALDPGLAAFRVDLPAALEGTLATLITGTLVRSTTGP
jgi:AcrR family transcriptional regulator